ncbi:hypothetical protein ACJ41O_012838 [Fusarium nematophilum]
MGQESFGVPDPTPGSQESTSSEDGITVHERDDLHLATRVIQTVLKPLKPSFVKAGNLPPEPTRLKPPKSALKRCDVDERQIQGLWTYDLSSKAGSEEDDSSQGRPRRRIIYFAGGGWQMPPSEHHWVFCAELVRRLPKTKVTIISSPLAPKDPVSVAFPQIEQTYRVLLRESTQAGETVIVGGDSSGGNLALCLVTWTLTTQADEHIKPPAAILAISPSADLRHENPDIKDADKVDPVLTASSINSTASTWCPPGPSQSPTEGKANLNTDSEINPTRLDWSYEDPRVSPIQADLSCLVRNHVKVHGVTGSRDVLTPEAIDFRERCKKEGVEGEWLAWEGQMHCFPLTFRYGLKESKEAVDWIAGVLEKH